MLQVDELQRAMGFSGDYVLSQGSRRDKIKLLGNGVCPPVMQHIVTTLTGSVASDLPACPNEARGVQHLTNISTKRRMTAIEMAPTS
jgi:hypothetical protein